MESPAVTIRTASLTLSNSTLCPHSVCMCFVWIWEQTAIISLYSINWLVFITETEFVYCAVRTGSLYTASLTYSNSTFCPHTLFMCFVWIWEQIAIISLYSINWVVFVTETEIVYCAVRNGFLYIIRNNAGLLGVTCCLYMQVLWDISASHPLSLFVMRLNVIYLHLDFTSEICSRYFSS